MLWGYYVNNRHSFRFADNAAKCGSHDPPELLGMEGEEDV